MKRSRTGSFTGEVLASPPVATVQLPLPLLDVLTETRTAFFGARGWVGAPRSGSGAALSTPPEGNIYPLARA